MSTHNICFRIDIKKKIMWCGYPLLSRAMLATLCIVKDYFSRRTMMVPITLQMHVVFQTFCKEVEKYYLSNNTIFKSEV